MMSVDLPEDDSLIQLIVASIREHYLEGSWEEIIELMASIENNPILSRGVFAESRGFLTEVYDWWYNGEGPKDNVRMFDPTKRKSEKDDDAEREG
jgi:hypothetical protein